VACFEVLVATDTCKEREDGMKRAMFLATAALLAMLILAPMAWAQGGTTIVDFPITTGSPTPVPIPDGGGPAILLPAVALLLGSSILTYAILRRR
jgi:hypothetical protein